ncbi:MAG TPA: response regulator [Nitrospira sp.]|nr:response regulator [Nitrospira sp.]
MAATETRQMESAPRRRAGEGTLGTVLVVDDEDSICRLVATVLQGEGYEVLRAGTAGQALAILNGRPSDLLLVDVRLPDMDGIALVKQAFEAAPELMAVAMTGYGTVDVAVEAMKAGAADFLMKPFRPDVLTATVRRLTDLRRLKQENAVLKRQLLKAGTVRLLQPALADFANGGRIQGADGLTDYERGAKDEARRSAQREQAERERERALLSALSQRLEDLWKNLHRTVQEDIAALAFSIACKVVRQVGESNREVVLEQIRAALTHVSDGGVVEITVHPADVDVVESMKETLLAGTDRSLTFVCCADPKILPGGCLVQTKSRLIDATLDTQLRRLGEALK